MRFARETVSFAQQRRSRTLPTAPVPQQRWSRRVRAPIIGLSLAGPPPRGPPQMRMHGPAPLAIAAGAPPVDARARASPFRRRVPEHASKDAGGRQTGFQLVVDLDLEAHGVRQGADVVVAHRAQRGRPRGTLDLRRRRSPRDRHRLLEDPAGPSGGYCSGRDERLLDEQYWRYRHPAAICRMLLRSARWRGDPVQITGSNAT